MLIESYVERQERIEYKRKGVLKFLRDEGWSSAFVLGQLLGLSKSGIYKTLGILAQEKLVTSYYVAELRMRVWGITCQGLLYVWDDHEEMRDRSPFEPSKLKPTMVQHHLDTQAARLNAQAAGWCGWMLGGQLPKGVEKRPDAIVHDVTGRRVAVELERTVKTKKRYEVIFSIYLQAIKRGEYHSIHYVCPDPAFAVRLRRLFETIEAVPVAGERVRIGEKHRAKFPVFSLSNWPQMIG